MPVAAFELQRPPEVRELTDHGVHRFGRVLVEIVEREPRRFIGVVPEQRAKCGIAFDHPLRRGIDEKDAFRTIDERAIARLGVVQRRREIGDGGSFPAATYDCDDREEAGSDAETRDRSGAHGDQPLRAGPLGLPGSRPAGV